MKTIFLIIRWFKSLYAWRAVISTGVWVYLENSVTGQRSAHWRGGAHQPLDRDFLRKGDLVHGPRGNFVIGEESEVRNG